MTHKKTPEEYAADINESTWALQKLINEAERSGIKVVFSHEVDEITTIVNDKYQKHKLDVDLYVRIDVKMIEQR